jgi:hypothetical protein
MEQWLTRELSQPRTHKTSLSAFIRVHPRSSAFIRGKNLLACGFAPLCAAHRMDSQV